MEFDLFIASCIENEKNLPRIIENIKTSKIPVNKVHIIIGGYTCYENNEYSENDNSVQTNNVIQSNDDIQSNKDTEIVNYIDGIEIVKVNYRCFEFTPMIYLVKNPDKYNFEYGFFTHDTVIFSDYFYRTIMQDIELLKKSNYEGQKIEQVMSMNIGIYKKESILKYKDTLLELCLYSNDKDVLWNMKNKLVSYEDFILNKSNCIMIRDIVDVKPMAIKNIDNKPVAIRCKLYKRIGLVKIQSNHMKIYSITPPIIDNALNELLKK